MTAKRYRRYFHLPFARSDPSDVEGEIGFHLDMRARELEAAGHDPVRARELAVAEFGDIEEAWRFCRAEDGERMRATGRRLWVEQLAQDARLAVRGLWRRPAFTLSTVVTLGLAIALAASAYATVHAYLIRPLPYPEADRLVRVRPAPTRDPFPNAPSLQSVDWRVAADVFGSTVWWNPDGFAVAGRERTEAVEGAWVSPSYFELLGVRPAAGRAFQDAEHATQAPVAIISDALWSRLFARDPSVIGRTIRMESAESGTGPELVTVIGIMAANAWHVHRFTDVIRPIAPLPQFPAIAQLERGMSMAEAERRLNAVVLPQLGEVDPAYRLSLAGVQQEYTFRLRPTLVALMSGAAFLLLIAGASVAGAQAARAASRRGEIEVRRALGASRGRVTLQLVVESTVIAVAAAGLGAFCAWAAISLSAPTIADRLGAAVPGGSAQLVPGGGMLAVVVSAGVVVGALFGLVPALLVTRRGAGVLGSQRAVGSAASPALRRGLIVAQIAFTMVLLAGAGLMARTILAITTTPLGFSDEQIVKGDIFLPPARYRGAAMATGVERLIAAASAEPGVGRVAASFPDPLRTFVVSPVPVAADGGAFPDDQSRRAAPHLVSAGYFDLLDIEIRQGRAFGDQDAAHGLPVAIVSEELARRLWPGEPAIGRRVRTVQDTIWRTVVGVAAETRHPVEPTVVPELYVPFAQSPFPLVTLLARSTGSSLEAAAALQRAVFSVDPGLGLAIVRELSELTDRASSRHRTLAAVLSMFAALALGLATLGLYASMAYVVVQRRRELAIRMAVGASPSAVRSIVLREGLLLVAAGLALGLMLSVAATRLIASQLHGVTPSDPATFAMIVTLLGAAALLAASAPLRHAVRIAPAEIMRND